MFPHRLVSLSLFQGFACARLRLLLLVYYVLVVLLLSTNLVNVVEKYRYLTNTNRYYIRLKASSKMRDNKLENDK